MLRLSLKILNVLELEYLLPPLNFSIKVSADITHFYGPTARNLDFEWVVSNKVGWEIKQGYNPYQWFENVISWKENLGRIRYKE